MHFAQASLVLAGISAVASAAFLENGKRDTGLEVTLTAAEGKAADVVATVKNVGTQSLNLLTLGTFLDSAPVQKLAVTNEASMLIPISYSRNCSNVAKMLLSPSLAFTVAFRTAMYHLTTSS